MSTTTAILCAFGVYLLLMIGIGVWCMKKTTEYKDMRPVHTIILFENSSSSLISEVDEELYFHVGKTKFNTGIKIKLLQDYVLVSLDTFKKYRYADIR